MNESLVAVGSFSFLAMLTPSPEPTALVVTGIVTGGLCFWSEAIRTGTPLSKYLISRALITVMYSIAVMLIVYYSLQTLGLMYNVQTSNLVYGALAALAASNAVNIVNFLTLTLKTLIERRVQK